MNIFLLFLLLLLLLLHRNYPILNCIRSWKNYLGSYIMAFLIIFHFYILVVLKGLLSFRSAKRVILLTSIEPQVHQGTINPGYWCVYTSPTLGCLSGCSSMYSRRIIL